MTHINDTDSAPQAQEQTARGPQPWERDLLEKVLLESLTEQRRARRWNVFFKVSLLVYLGLAFWLASAPFSESPLSAGKGKHTAVVDITGVIMDGADSNAETVIDGLNDAVKDKGTKGVILRMNSPGGSPVQSAYIYAEIRRVKAEHPDLPVYAVVEDICASGCYYIAAAADKIFINPSSIVGSIGVIMNGFGFVDTLSKLGVERRLMTAGAHKAVLDPFSPVNPEEKQHIQGLIDTVHRQFIDAVKQGRGERLKDGEHPELFSGLVWTGDAGIALGLADAAGSPREVAKNDIGAEKLVNFTPRKNLLDRLTHNMGTAAGKMLQGAVATKLRLE
jgi:protease-4